MLGWLDRERQVLNFLSKRLAGPRRARAYLPAETIGPGRQGHWQGETLGKTNKSAHQNRVARRVCAWQVAAAANCEINPMPLAARTAPHNTKTKPVATARDLARLDWPAIAGELDSNGCAVIGPLLRPEACRALAALYAREAPFRSHIIMARHGFGRGEYKYFAAPLPANVADLRTRLYRPLAAIANRWYEQMRMATRFPSEHTAFLARCHGAGQSKPTPLLLRYGLGDYNCLHQDVYGELVFPLQVAVLLSDPATEFTGGEFVLTEQRPRMQSRAQVAPLRQGDAVIFPVRERPVAGTRGVYRVNMRHGVSRLRSGHRYTLGIIFHDAR